MSQGANKAGGVIGSPYAISGTGLNGSYGQITLDSLNNRHEFDDGLDIRLTPAAGGFVVSIFHRNSGNRPSLHLITEDQDLGAELGKIITMSYLKKA